MLAAAVVLCARASPVPEVSLAGDTSGEEEESAVTSERLSTAPYWDLILKAAKLEKEFEVEFQSLNNDSLEQYKIPSLPRPCPSSNFSKEACLQRLIHGLSTYAFLLKHVEKQYPGNSILPTVDYYISVLIKLMKKNINTRHCLKLPLLQHQMRNPESVVMVTSSQEEQLQRELDNPSEFHRKVTAYSLLRELGFFLVDGKRALAKRERFRGRLGRKTAPAA
ncbi:interleukin-6 [Neosynchiropus ocellatus]